MHLHNIILILLLTIFLHFQGLAGNIELDEAVVQEDMQELENIANTEELPEDPEITNLMHSNDQAIGFSSGATGGIGLSYRYWPNDHGIQLTILPIIAEEFHFISFGISHLYMLRRNKNASLYLSSGLHYLNINGEFVLNAGVGPAINTSLWEVVGINLMFGYGIYGFNIPETIVFPTSEIGIYYWF